jgi:hypothetical protein
MKKNDSLLTKIDIITKIYIRVLYNKFCKREQLHKDDFQSLKANIKLLVQNKRIFMIYDNFDDIEASDSTAPNYSFVMGFTTFKQHSYLLNNDVKYIMIDSTFSTNMYNYKLITGLSLLNGSISLPLFYLIASNEQEITLKKFTRKLLEAYPKIKLGYVMSDLAPNFYNSFCIGAKEPPKWFWCEWHFKKAIKKNLNLLVKSNETRNIIKERLDLISNIRTKNEFMVKLKEFDDFLKNNASDFGNYFNKLYRDKSDKWALYARLDIDLNVNMFCESFFRYFKVEILKGKRSNRLDTVLKKLREYDFLKWREVSIRSECEDHGLTNFREQKAGKNHKNGAALDRTKFKEITTTLHKFHPYFILKREAKDICSCTDVMCKKCDIC